MPKYLLSAHSVEGQARPPMSDEEMKEVYMRVLALEGEMKSSGAWVFGGRLHEPRMALTVAGIIIMVPGSYAFQAVVLFNQGKALGGLQAAVQTGLVVGGMALGLATARFLSERKWRFE